ncbi:Lrp/AsnC family transcriptional regulator [Bosea sp. (in: a-proteobacteria)]|uniref:Lrp/AsnC family transcriptional regulator n=1 Tax=Bosea sp. (in: a-proteobacteria) TaxID=1871050 RepID=UPI0012048514|nr:Lrp/AsnC family transcriptional regulator [Bosea sp. (in: a-proteobacteria)]TAJ29338.1 MAG: Lrp/AsnC family transcriptional regulator [Bosea sp. (in: a-proteobacteria)]
MTGELSDKIDRRLLALLQSNARDSTTTLAKKLGVARTTVHERITRMERNGLIRGYSAVLSRDPFETYVASLLMLIIVKQKQTSIVEQLKRFPEIKLCQAVNGECDILCEVEVPHLEDLEALLIEISEIGGITNARTMIVTALKFDRRMNAAGSQAAVHAAAFSRGEAG